jgi:hypothetical protein
VAGIQSKASAFMDEPGRTLKVIHRFGNIAVAIFMVGYFL